jgi:hypothetical protein
MTGGCRRCTTGDGAGARGLKIRVSVVRFRPWPECGLGGDLDVFEGAQLFITELQHVHRAPLEVGKELVFFG